MKNNKAARQAKRGLAHVNLDSCSYRGKVFDQNESDLRIEDQFFPGWRNLLMDSLPHVSPSTFQAGALIVEDGGHPALKYDSLKPWMLVCGDEYWGDLTIEADCRVLDSHTFPQTIDELTHDFKGRSGLVFRIQDVRRHLFVGFVEGRSLVIAVREDTRWEVLSQVDFFVDPYQYYHFELHLEGARASLKIDGHPVLSVADLQWLYGPVGLYSNTLCLWRNVTVVCAPAEAEDMAKRREQAANRQKERSGKLPPPVVQDEIEIDMPKTTLLQISRVLPGDEGHLLFIWEKGTERGLLCTDHAGRTLWRKTLWPVGFARKDRPDHLYDVLDLDLDGKVEIVTTNDCEIIMLDACNGGIKARAPLPDACPFISLRHQKALFNRDNVHIWHLHGYDQPASIVLFMGGSPTGGHTVWCYDHKLELRWTHSNTGGRHGHDIAWVDPSDQGKGIILCGHYALNGAGEMVWSVENHDLMNWHSHADRVVAGYFNASDCDLPVVAFTRGNYGLMLVDGRTGALIREVSGIGHCQHLYAGNFLPKLPGEEVWVVNDWGSCGIHHLFDAEGNRLRRFQLDPRTIFLQPIRWTCDQDFIFIHETPETFGIWDGEGGRLFDLMASELIPASVKPSRTGLPLGFDFRVMRLPGQSHDVIGAVDAQRLILFGPDMV